MARTKYILAEHLNQMFYQLTVKGMGEPRPDRQQWNRRTWKCQCDCGNFIDVFPHCLFSGNTKSCGCRNMIVLMERNITHGMTKHPLYAIWSQMRVRCHNPNATEFHNYGGRGIAICERWNDFAVFVQDMGDRPSLKHSLDRKDNAGNYEPANCQWSTQKEQMNNTRINRMITHNGRTQTLVNWCRELHLDYAAVRARLNKLQWTEIKALTTPIRSMRLRA